MERELEVIYENDGKASTRMGAEGTSFLRLNVQIVR
jgi:hypothetical protein